MNLNRLALVLLNAYEHRSTSGSGRARRGGSTQAARSIPRIWIPGEHTCDRSVLVGKLAEILRDQRPARKVTAMFIEMAFGSPIYERLRALGFNNVFETNFGLLHGAIESDEKM